MREVDCSRVRYAHPRRVTASSYHPVSGRSLLEDSITSGGRGEDGGGAAAVVREAIFYQVIPMAKP